MAGNAELKAERDVEIVSGGIAEFPDRGMHIFDLANMPWHAPIPRESVDPAGDVSIQVDTDGVLERMLVRPDETRLLATLIRFPPNYVMPPHWHTEGEFVVVMKGSLFYGGVEVRPGGMAYNDSHTVYGAETAGPDGCEFLLIRRGESKTTCVSG